ncbi:MAG: endolytic transglycosylase MltG [Anaerolineales bacterium]|nr:endolytic transglycosylase MltG [Anaerolineales bacterium]
MERISSRRPAKPPKQRLSCLSWLFRLGTLLFVLALVFVTLGLIYSKSKDFGGTTTIVIGGDTTTISPNDGLSAAERAYLRGYLTLHAADVEKPAGSDETPRQFIVESGESASGIADRLASDGLIADATLFRYYLRYYDLDSGLEAGEFTLQQSMTIPEIAQTLSHAVANEIEIRSTEGWRYEQIGDYLFMHTEFGIDPNEFLLMARNTPQSVASGLSNGVDPLDFLYELPDEASLEGYLFPDTYRLPADATAADLVNTMLYTFDRRVTPEIRQAFAEQGLTLHGAITLASIIEREAQLADERPIMASVFLNRLVQGMKLDADPTVQYALGYQQEAEDWWKRPLYLEDLEIDSPYNTYRFEGLPPGPIASPGLASIEAVAYPAQTNFLYFVVDCTSETPGAHVFSETFEEHQANVAQCQ